MPVRCLTLLSILTLALGLAACGADNSLSTDIPRTSPDLTIPTATTAEPPVDTTTNPATSTTDTTTSATAPGAVTPQAPPAPAAPTGSATTGGQAPAAQSTTGGATTGGEFENFCAQNPGAC
jgi:hypothetical protein